MGEMNSQSMDLNSSQGGATSLNSGTNGGTCLNVFQLVEPVKKELFQKFLHCLKCSGTCIPPIFVCTKDHHICKECQQDMKDCWICKTEFKGGRNFFYEYCFENSTFKCKYLREGCEETVLGKKIKDHLLSCDYRPINCFACEKKDIPYNKFLKHYADSHRMKITLGEDGKFQRHYTPRFVANCSPWSRWSSSTVIEFDGNAFFPFAYHLDGVRTPGIGVFLCIFGNDKDAQKYNVHISLESETGNLAGKPFGSQRPKYWLGWEGPVLSIRVDPEEILEGGKCFLTFPAAIKTVCGCGEQSDWTPTFKIARVPVSTD